MLLPMFLRRSRALYVEYPHAREGKEFERLARSVNDLQRRCAVNGRVRRGLHANAIAVLHGDLRVLPGVPDKARFGFLARGDRFRVTARFSAASPAVVSDGSPDFYGLAVRVNDISGGPIQDLVMTNKPRASAPNARVFRALIESTERGRLPRLAFLLGHPVTAAFLITARHPVASVAEEVYWSGDPIRWGHRVVKYFVRPGLPEPGRGDAFVGPDLLARELGGRLSRGPVSFTLALQFQADPYRMPIENGLVVWSEELSPAVPVAEIVFPDQPFDTPDRREEGERLEFSVWNCLDDAVPVGQLNRARRFVYPASQGMRREAG